MNTIKDLIDKYCPDGVEYKKLGEVCKTIPAPVKVKTSQYLKKGKYAIIDQGQSKIAGYTNDEFILIPKGEYVLYGDHTCTVKYVNFRFAQGADGLKILKTEQVLTKYLYYALSNFNIKNNEYKRHWSIVKEIYIPVPPISVQREIVRILDSFTSLEAELEAELEARRKQYEYYRDQLLSFKHLSGGGKNEVEWKTLGEMGTFIRGNGLQKKDFTDNGFPCIHYGQIHTTYNTFTDKTVSYTSFEKAKHLKKAHKGDLLIATTSEDVDACCKAVAWLGESQCAISGDSYIYHHNQDPKYIAYLFQTDMFAKQKKTAATGTKVIRVSGDAMAKFKFPIPPLSTQRRIVSILDRFESLVNDISTGLPAEIAARHQQYEYYRDQLLSFKRKS